MDRPSRSLLVAAIAAIWEAPVQMRAADPEILAIRPISGPAGAGTAVSIYGTSFAAAPTVAIGGAATTGTTLAGPTQINALTPALTPGSVSDVVVTVPGLPPVNLPGAWFAQFLDVPPSYLFARPIERLRRTGITTGCGGGKYCPEDSVTRAQMAVFILRGKHGSSYHPPPATGTVFDDVPKTALLPIGWRSSRPRASRRAAAARTTAPTIP